MKEQSSGIRRRCFADSVAVMEFKRRHFESKRDPLAVSAVSDTLNSRLQGRIETSYKEKVDTRDNSLGDPSAAHICAVHTGWLSNMAA